ncbi:MAG TPA: hypothetical protein VLM91_05000 [Candidatus Methylomirabilis sp.]|nr:hypothetical protein [Candidatus Methylomirabilis sp.]
MRPFKAFRLTWWQAGLLKLSMVALGLAVGSTWPAVFVGWQGLLWILFVVPGFYLSYMWLKQI